MNWPKLVGIRVPFFAPFPSTQRGTNSVSSPVHRYVGMAMKPPRKHRPHAAPHIPVWDSQRRLLRVGDRVLFHFAQHARSQEPILAAFEEDRWPPRIDNPLDGNDETDARERLHYAVKRLNAKTRQVIRFLRDGTGDGVIWEWANS
jgi:hypothetical protein